MRAQTSENPRVRSSEGATLSGAPRRKVSLARTLNQEFVFETRGNDFTVWRRTTGIRNGTSCQASLRKLERSSLSAALSELEYRGQPMSVILHPPCVCLKVLTIDSGNPDSWLAAHLADISPPVNRRELMMSFQHFESKRLQVAFVRRSFIAELATLFRSSRVSVSGIYVGGAIAVEAELASGLDSGGASANFALCTYQLHVSEGDYQLLASLDKSGTVGTSPDSFTIVSGVRLKRQSIDFRIQAGLPKALSISKLSIVVRAQLRIALLCICATILYWGARSINSDHTVDSSYQTAVRELRTLRQQSQSFRSELESIGHVRRPTFVASTFLRTVATATPGQTMLGSITYSNNAEAGKCNFSLTGYSKDGNGPLELTDSLRNGPQVLSAALTRVGLVDSPVGNLGNAQSHLRWTKFEIAGEYAGE